MWEGSYGKEPFDLRLTVLRFIRCLHIILILTLVGTLLFGGGYYVKNVLLRPAKEYSATSVYKVQYVVSPTQSGDYFINEMTWNTLVQSEEFLNAVQKHLTVGQGGLDVSLQELSAAISAKLPSDWNVPTTTVVTNSPEQTVLIAAAVEAAMINEFVENMEEVQAVRVIDSAAVAEEVELDVRPGRAFVLSAILSFLFVTVLFFLKELGDDSIWLPATLRHRYGLKVLGTVKSPVLQENLSYFFRGKSKIAVCPVDDNVDVANVIAMIAGAVAEPKSGKNAEAGERKSGETEAREWIAVPAPMLCPESSRTLREMDGILLVVNAGSHVGKPLEYVLEYLSQQDCKITAVILCDADEWLIDAYYCFNREKDR